MTTFDIHLNYEGTFLHSATIRNDQPEISLHFFEEDKLVGTLIIEFQSIDAVKKFIFDLECAFVDERFIVEGEQ